MKYFFIISCFLFLLNGCQTNQQHSITDRKSFINVADCFKVKPTEYYYQFDTSLSELENYDRGWIDTFSIDGNMFQLLFNPDSSKELEMQVYKNGRWQRNLDTYFGSHGVDHKTDMNNDGFVDYQFFSGDSSWVYLYDKADKAFRGYAFATSHDFELVDSSNSIYGETWRQNEFRHIADLYKFNGLDQYFLYSIKAIKNKKSDSVFTALRLYQCSNGKLADTSFIKDYNLEENIGTLNYKKYWKEILLQEKN